MGTQGLGVMLIGIALLVIIVLVAVSVFFIKVFGKMGASNALMSGLDNMSFPCRYCSSEIPSQASTCPSCGAPVSEYVSTDNAGVLGDFAAAFQKGENGTFSKTIVERENDGRRKSEKVTVINVRRTPF